MNEGLELRSLQIDEVAGISSRELRAARRQIDAAARRMEREGRLEREPTMRSLIQASYRQTDGERQRIFREKVAHR